MKRADRGERRELMEPEERGGRGERGEVDGREDSREGEGRQRVEMREE